MIHKLIKKAGLNPESIMSVSAITLGNVTAQAFRFLFWFIVVWIVTPKEYGYLRYALTLASFFSIPVVSGFAGAITKFMSENLDDRKRMSFFAFQTLFADLIVLITILILSLIANSLNKERFSMVIIYMIAVLGTYSMYYSFSRGMIDVGRIISFTVSVNVYRTVMVILLYAIGLRGTSWALFAYGFPLILGLLISRIYKKKSIALKIYRPDREAMRKIARFAIPGMLSAGMWTFIGRVDILFITHFFGFEETAYYSLAKTLSLTLGFVTQAIIVIQMPKVSSFRSDRRKIYSYTKKSLKMAVMAVVPLSALLYLTAPFILRFFPPDYARSIPFLYLIIPGTVFSGLFALLGATWIGYGKPEEEAKVTAIGSVAIIAFNLILIGPLGIYGIPVSFFLAELLIFVIMLIMTERYFGDKKHI